MKYTNQILLEFKHNEEAGLLLFWVKEHTGMQLWNLLLII